MKPELTVELAISLDRTLSATLAGVFLVISMFFVWRSFYGMRITTQAAAKSAAAATPGTGVPERSYKRSEPCNAESYFMLTSWADTVI